MSSVSADPKTEQVADISGCQSGLSASTDSPSFLTIERLGRRSVRIFELPRTAPPWAPRCRSRTSRDLLNSTLPSSSASILRLYMWRPWHEAGHSNDELVIVVGPAAMGTVTLMVVAVAITLDHRGCTRYQSVSVVVEVASVIAVAAETGVGPSASASALIAVLAS